MKKEKSYRVFTFYAILLQFMILVSQNMRIENLSTSSIKDYTIRDATVQVLINYSSFIDSPQGFQVSYSGTGTIVGIKENSLYVLTVKHVCLPDGEDEFLNQASLIREIEIQDPSGEFFTASLVAVSTIDDLCMIKYESHNASSATIAQISNRPAYLDEEIYMYAAPSGFYVPSAITQFRGVSAGSATVNSENTAVYTTPATGGSSGAAVVSSDGKIVGVLHSTLVDFHHISLATPHNTLIDFIEVVEIQEEISILD